MTDDPNFPFVGDHNSAQDLHQGRFTGPVFTNQGDHFARVQAETHAAQGLGSTITLGDSFNFQQGSLHGRFHGRRGDGHLPSSLFSSAWNSSTFALVITRCGMSMIPSAGITASSGSRTRMAISFTD